MTKYEKDYLALCEKVLKEGIWVYNNRTGRRCLTIPEHTLYYDGQGLPPLLTTKRSFPVSAFAEILGYLRRYEWATQFADIGTKTWFSNANETQAWLDNPSRKGENHLGKVYGAALEDWELPALFAKLEHHIDDRGLMINFWRPEKFIEGCLRPCMYKHSFTILDGTLHMCSESRSMDLGLGSNFNSLQCYFLLVFFAKLAGLKAGTVKHNIINCHIYESHIDAIKEQLSRTPSELNVDFKINENITSFNDLLQEKHAREYFTIEGYNPQDKIEMELIP